jgi:hypothetical protein
VGVAVGPVQPPSPSAVTQSREETGGPLRAELCVGGIPGHPAFHQDHVLATDLVLQAYLMLCTLRDPLLTPAMDAGEVDIGKINGHPARLSVDIGQVTT